MTRTLRLSQVVIAAAAAGCVAGVADHAVTVAKISAADFVVEGLSQTATSDDVKRQLGTPFSHRAVPLVPQPPGGYSWNYRDLDFTFDRHDERLIAVLTGSTRQTARGLRVGQSAKQAIALYGPPSHQDDTHLSWKVTEDDSSALGMIVIVSEGVVTTIFLGEVIEE